MNSDRKRDTLSTHKKTCFLIDGSSFLYRAFYALKPLTSPRGETVQAVYGFCRMLLKLLKQHAPTHLALVWDSPGKTARHELYPEYKAHRDVPPADLFTQKTRIQSIVELMGITQIAEVGIEADDLLYSCALDLEKQDYQVVIVSADKDLRQMASPSITIFDPFLERKLTQEELQTLYGFSSDRLPLYFALLGDSSDNIPGVKGIGKKGATDLALRFASLDELYANLHELKPKVRETLEISRENAYLSLKLFLLRYARGDYRGERFEYSGLVSRALGDVFAELGFSSLLKELNQSLRSGQSFGGGAILGQLPLSADFPIAQTTAQSDVLGTCIGITKMDDFIGLCESIQAARICALDTETKGNIPEQIELVGFSVCCEDGKAYYIPLAHHIRGTGEEQLAIDDIRDRLTMILGDASIKKIFHNAKFDLHAFNSAGFVVEGLAFDTMVAAHLLESEDESVGLKQLSERLLSMRMLSFKEVVESRGYKNFAEVPLAEASAYAATDALQTWRLYHMFEPRIRSEGFEDLFYNLEMPLIPLLFTMERAGMPFNASILLDVVKKLEERVAAVQGAMVELLGPSYGVLNFNSPAQIAKLLFEDLGLVPVKKTAKGGASTDNETLRALVGAHPFIALLIKYRALHKVLSTYGTALIAFQNPLTGRIHSSFSQTRAATGRLSSSEPNLQNIPLASESENIAIRDSFVAPEGMMFISADYSQIELRVLAQLSGDQKLVDAFNHNQDIHTRTAQAIFGISENEVTSAQRGIAKRINFGIIYGLTPYGLSQELDISQTEARRYCELFWQQYPGVVAWMHACEEEAKKNGYITTWGGRKRIVSGIYEQNKSLYQAARRIVINTPCQGSAAELIKKGMIACDQKFKELLLDAQMVLQVHDEIIVLTKEPQAEAVARVVREALEGVAPGWKVPLKVSIRIGKTWHQVSK